MTILIHAFKSDLYLFAWLVVSFIQRDRGLRHSLSTKKPAAHQKIRCLENKRSLRRRLNFNDDFDGLADQIGYTSCQDRFHLIAKLAFEPICLLTAT